jgi:hypothetical protein
MMDAISYRAELNLVQLLQTRHGNSDVEDHADAMELQHHNAIEEEGSRDPSLEMARAAHFSFVRNMALAQIAAVSDEIGLYAVIPDEAELYLHSDVAHSRGQKRERDSK